MDKKGKKVLGEKKHKVPKKKKDKFTFCVF